MLNTIVAFSDLHYNKAPQRLISVIEESAYCFFLGDGLSSLGDIICHKGFHGVKGNCDLYDFPDEEVLEIDQVKILLTHGNKYHVKQDLNTLYYRAKELNCDLVLYGHTHYAEEVDVDGIKFINPGAICSPMTGIPTYCYIVIDGKKIITKIVNLE